jgi:hypothetical protein
MLYNICHNQILAYLEIEAREEINRDLLNGALVRDRLLGLGPEFDVIDKYLF